MVVTTKAAVLDHLNGWKQFRQCTGSSGLGGATFSTDQHTTDACIHSIQDQRTQHALLADNGCEWKDHSLVHINNSLTGSSLPLSYSNFHKKI
jgi:hypothetical protein